MICRLSYEDGPSKNKQNKHTSDRLITEHPNRVAGCNLSALVAAFNISQNPDDAFKLGSLGIYVGLSTRADSQ